MSTNHNFYLFFPYSLGVLLLDQISNIRKGFFFFFFLIGIGMDSEFEVEEDQSINQK
jgi:hypothetical protein